MKKKKRYEFEYDRYISSPEKWYDYCQRMLSKHNFDIEDWIDKESFIDYKYGYCNDKCDVLGPAPCPVPKINFNYRYRLTVRCGLNKNLRHLFAHLLRQFSQDRECRGVSAFVDINGTE